MKKQILFIALFISSLGFSQSINDYKTVIIPLKFDFIKTDNQYRLATLSKFNLNKAGFQAYYSNEEIPSGSTDRCSLMDFDVVKESSFLSTKLHIVFKDCYGKVIFQSETGLSKEKDYQLAYTEALNRAFESVIALEYKYNGNVNSAPVEAKAIPAPVKQVVSEVVKPVGAVSVAVSSMSSNTNNSGVLYAQPILNGFQLIDNKPSVVLKVMKTSSPDCYFAVKGAVNGIMINKNNQWFFEFYEGDKLMSEKVDVKF